MFCSQCGANVQPGQQFCSLCGRPLTTLAPSGPGSPPTAAPAPITPQAPATSQSPSLPRPSSLARHIKVLGILWLIYSGLRLIPGIGLLFLGHTRFPFMIMPVPWQIREIGGPFLSAVGFAISGFAIAGIIAALGLMAYAPWARILILVLAIINLIHLPLGTALGIYTLWALFSTGADREYRRLGAIRAAS